MKNNIGHGGVCTILDGASNNAEWNQQIMTVKEEFNTLCLNNITDCYVQIGMLCPVSN